MLQSSAPTSQLEKQFIGDFSTAASSGTCLEAAHGKTGSDLGVLAGDAVDGTHLAQLSAEILPFQGLPTSFSCSPHSVLLPPPPCQQSSPGVAAFLR